MSKKSEIVSETFSLFAQKGYEFTLSDVAKVVGIKKQSIYNYFNNKEDLIEQMLIKYIEEYFSVFKMIRKKSIQMETKDKLLIICSSIYKYFEDSQKLLVRKRIGLDKNKLPRRVYEILDKYEKYVSNMIYEIFKEGIRNKQIRNQEIENIHSYFIILIRGLIDGLFVLEAQNDREKFVNNMFEMFWKQIKTRI
jgi:AcrR family transcriptional regulator